jgi:hypothetical protein
LDRHEERAPQARKSRRTATAALILLGVAAAVCGEGVRGAKYLDFDLPAGGAPAAVAITLDFIMGDVAAPGDVIIEDYAYNRQVPSRVLAAETWPDGSQLSVKLAFIPEPGGRYRAVWNGGTPRTDASRDLAALQTVPAAGLDAPPPGRDAYEVGSITIQVSGGGLDGWLTRYRTPLYFVPIGVLLIVLIARKVYLRRA